MISTRIRRYAAGMGLAAVAVSVPTAALAPAQPPRPHDPCRMEPPPRSCDNPTMRVPSPNGGGPSANPTTTVVTAVVGASLSTLTATYIPLTATVSGVPTVVTPTAAVATPTVNGTRTPMTFILRPTTGSAIRPWQPPPR